MCLGCQTDWLAYREFRRNLSSTLRHAQGLGQVRFPFLMFSPCGVGKPRLSLLMMVFVMDSQDILTPIDFDSVNLMEDSQVIPEINCPGFSDKDMDSQ